MRFYPLRERENRVFIERDHIKPDDSPQGLTDTQERLITETAERIVEARKCGASRMLAFGAHAIKNGLAPVMARLIEDGWVTHLATNGAGIIHDWEFTFIGESSEHVAANVAQGQFGMWEEPGFYLNLALAVGAFEGRGYGESVGAMVENEGVEIPSEEALIKAITGGVSGNLERSAAAADLLFLVRRFELNPGWLDVPHAFKRFGLQAAAYRLGVPLTGHPMIGHDIIYLHPMNHCAAIGRVAQRDFLTFAEGVRNVTNGVYMSIGSAVMSPMVFEKSMSLSQNAAQQEGKRIENHFIMVVDLAESHWDWQQGEPPEDHPDYYLRYNKSFSRMGGTMRYLSADNRDFLLALLHNLQQRSIES
ncbi:MAG: hypothetical protein R6V12_02015 [Candidatus Hydrogenedentota bacterium]